MIFRQKCSPLKSVRVADKIVHECDDNRQKKTFQHSLEIRKVANQRSKRLKAMDECLEEISNTECD